MISINKLVQQDKVYVSIRLFAACVLFNISIAAHGNEAIQATVNQHQTILDASVERALRPMQVHKEIDMGLEIWTEHNPEWIVAKRNVNGRPVFIYQNPEKTYPPASMSVTSFANLLPAEYDDFEQYAEIALQQGLDQYGVAAERHSTLLRTTRQYGKLNGVEINFSTLVHGAPADVKIFIGRGENKGPVLLQVFTVEGSMQHLSEHIRRSWDNIRYL